MKAIAWLTAIGILIGGGFLFMVSGASSVSTPCSSLSVVFTSVYFQNVPPTQIPDEVAGYSGVQLTNAAVIIKMANDRNLGTQGARVALITAMQESRLRNLANAGEFTYPASGSRVMTEAQWKVVREQVKLSTTMPNDGVAPGDWDSIGLFQGRLSAGWGGAGTITEQVEHLLDPAYTAGRFFDALVAVQGWEQLSPTVAAQRVQRSAFPDAYEKHWEASGAILEALTGTSTPAIANGPCGPVVSQVVASSTGWTKPILNFKALSSPYGWRIHPVYGVSKLHEGQDFAANAGAAIFAASAGTVVKAGRASRSSDLNWVVIDHGGGIETAYLHSEDDGILVKAGQQVVTGQQIALVGSTGASTGPHLHFEVHVDGKVVDPMAFLADHGVTY